MRMSSHHIEQTAAEWLARRDGSDWSTDDEIALDGWLGQDIAHHVAFLRLQAAWDASDRLRALAAGRGATPDSIQHAQGQRTERRQQMLQAMRPRVATRAPGRRTRRWPLRIATAAVLACVALLLAERLPRHPEPPTITYSSAPGVVRTLVLADGSRATLSSDSRIDTRFSAHARDVHLIRGEAIFTVSKDPGRPFRVSSGGYAAIAVGTRYSVRQEASSLRVVVTEGTVRLETPASATNASPAILLPAGSVAVVRRNGVLVRSLPLAQVNEMLDWPNGMLAFRDAPLTEVAAEFNRFNTRKLVIADANAAALRIGGNFRWDNVDGFVHLLEVGFPIRAEASVDRIVLHSR